MIHHGTQLPIDILTVYLVSVAIVRSLFTNCMLSFPRPDLIDDLERM